MLGVRVSRNQGTASKCVTYLTVSLRIPLNGQSSDTFGQHGDLGEMTSIYFGQCAGGGGVIRTCFTLNYFPIVTGVV